MYKAVILMVVLILMLTISTRAHAIATTPTGVLMDIWGVQVDAFQAVSQKTIANMSSNAMADLEYVYGLVEQEILDMGGVDLSKSDTLIKVVDMIYTNPVLASKSGFASALNSIVSLVDEVEAVNDLLSIIDLGQAIAKNAPKAATELKELIKNDQRNHILRNILEYGSGNRNGRIQAMLTNINETTHSNLFQIANSLYQIDQVNRASAEKIFGAMVYLTQKQIADEYADNFSNGPWQKITIQDFVVKKWVLARIINDGNMQQFYNQDIYTKETSAFLCLPIVENIFKAGTRYDLLSQADQAEISAGTIDPTNYVDFQLDVTSAGTNKYSISLPVTVSNHATYGTPTAVTYTIAASNVLQSYPGAISSSQYITGSTGPVKSFVIDLGQNPILKYDMPIDVVVAYGSNSTIKSFAPLSYTPQITSVQLTSLPTQFMSSSFPVTLQLCGDSVNTATVAYKNSSQPDWDTQSGLQLQNPTTIDQNCRAYNLQLDGWNIFRYTGGNRDVAIKLQVADKESPVYSRFLQNLDDTDNDGLPDSWENLYFNNLSETAGGDFDGDGASNYQEFLHNTDPTKAGARGITEIEELRPVEDINHNWTYDYTLSGAHWTSIVQTSTNVTLAGNVIVAGDYTLNGNSLDLRGRTLTIYGNLYHSGGDLKVNNGKLIIKGDYLIQTKNADGSFGYSFGMLHMANAADYVLVEGNFVAQSAYSHAGLLIAGTLEVRKNFSQDGTSTSGNNFNPTGSHRVLLSGTTRQTVSFTHPLASYSRFNILEITNSSAEWVVFAASWNVITLVSNGHKLNPLTVNSMDWTLNANETIAGDLQLQGSTLDLNGKTLTVEGNLYHSGGDLKVNNGTLIVKGDYRIQTKNADGSFGYSFGMLHMTNAADYVLVEGNFVTQSAYSHAGLLIAGTLEVRKNFTQDGTSTTGNNFNPTGSHRVLLSGTTRQTVSFTHPLASYSRFNILEITNSSAEWVVFAASWNGITLVSNGHKLNPLTVNSMDWTLNANETIAGDLQLQGSTLDLNGKTLIVEGNLYHSGGDLKVNNGKLIIKGDYLIQTKNADGSFGYSFGMLYMTNAADYVLVEGSFVTQSAYSHAGLLTAGTLEVRKNFTQDGTSTSGNNFNPTGSHRVLLSGTTRQTVSFTHPLASYSRFNILEITNSSAEWVVFASSWNVITLVSNGHKLNPLTVNSMDWTLNANETIAGDLQLQGSTLDLNGKTLIVEGNLYHSGGDLKVNNGTLIVKGDYLIQTKNGDGSFGYSFGMLHMTNAADYVLVEGNFVTQSAYSHEGLLIAGTLEVRKDFSQDGTSTTGNNFNPTGSHRVLLSGTTRQTVSFTNPYDTYSRFNILEIINSSTAGVVFTTKVVVTKLFKHQNKKFTLMDPSSEFPDYDGDGVKDNLDAEPLNPQVSTLSSLTLTLSGSGNGSVNSIPSGIACTTGTCSGSFANTSDVILAAVADSASFFTGWSGDCTNTSGNCSVTMDTAKNVTATFTAAPKVKVGVKEFASIQAANNDVATQNNAIIKLLEGTLTENVIFNRNISVILDGGYLATYSGIGTETSIKGKLLLRSGTVRVNKVNVK